MKQSKKTILLLILVVSLYYLNYSLRGIYPTSNINYSSMFNMYNVTPTLIYLENNTYFYKYNNSIFYTYYSNPLQFVHEGFSVLNPLSYTEKQSLYKNTHIMSTDNIVVSPTSNLTFSYLVHPELYEVHVFTISKNNYPTLIETDNSNIKKLVNGIVKTYYQATDSYLYRIYDNKDQLVATSSYNQYRLLYNKTSTNTIDPSTYKELVLSPIKVLEESNNTNDILLSFEIGFDNNLLNIHEISRIHHNYLRLIDNYNRTINVKLLSDNNEYGKWLETLDPNGNILFEMTITNNANNKNESYVIDTYDYLKLLELSKLKD